jgi:pyridoxine kinase
MPLVLILSSYVAASRVGGMAQALALAPFGIDAVLAPSVLFGRHPGWGPPGGRKVEAAVMGEVIDGIAANGLLARVDVLISGYYVDPDQVALAAATIDRVRAQSPAVEVIVDPVLGDAGRGFFVPPAVCEAVALQLIPRADLITPNLFELEYLSGGPIPDRDAAVAAARRVGRPALVTSAPAGDGEIGALYVDTTRAVMATHRRLDFVPQGTGDLICALWAAARIDGLAPAAALERATRGMAEALEAAQAWAAPELPIVRLGDRLVRPTAEVRIETLP